jgi:hypothetical protein
VTLRARWVTLRARWVTLRARWVTLRARWVTLRARWVTLRARWWVFCLGGGRSGGGGRGDGWWRGGWGGGGTRGRSGGGGGGGSGGSSGGGGGVHMGVSGHGGTDGGAARCGFKLGANTHTKGWWLLWGCAVHPLLGRPGVNLRVSHLCDAPASRLPTDTLRPPAGTRTSPPRPYKTRNDTKTIRNIRIQSRPLHRPPHAPSTRPAAHAASSSRALEPGSKRRRVPPPLTPTRHAPFPLQVAWCSRRARWRCRPRCGRSSTSRRTSVR